MRLRNVGSCAAQLVRVWGAFLRAACFSPRSLPPLCRRLLDYEAQARARHMRHGSLEEFLAEELGVNGVTVALEIPGLVGVRGIALGEAVALCALAAAVRAKRVFEIGTYRGWTSLALASALGEEGRVFTLDLLAGAAVAHRVERRDVYSLSREAVGEAFNKGASGRAEIVQLWGDSATFDFSPWSKSVDLVFVDGAHTEPYVRNDSERAFGLVREGGLIVWHDLKQSCPGVGRVLMELGRTVRLFHIEDTSLVVYCARTPRAAPLRGTGDR